MTTYTKLEYLHELERKLAVLPENERQSALRYYEDHITTAENEATAIAALGAPGEVAAEVLANYVKRANGAQTPPPVSHSAMHSAPVGAPMGMGMRPIREARHRGIFDYWWVILIVAIVGFPVLIGVGGGLFGVTIGVGSALFAFFVSGFAMAATGLVSVILSVFIIFQDFGFGLITAGAGLMLLGLGILFIQLAVCVFKWIVSLIKKLVRMVQNGRPKHA